MIKYGRIIGILIVLFGILIGLVSAEPELVTVDATGLTGESSSLQLDGGNPVISYLFDSFSLRLARCSDPLCAGAITITTVDDSGVVVGQDSSLQLNGGNPVISYFDFLPNDDLRFVACDDANCTAETPVTLDNAGAVGGSTSLQLNGSNPVVAYHDYTNGNIKAVICDDPNCSAETPITVVSSANFVGQVLSMQLDSANNPVIAYRETDNVTFQDVMLARCTTNDCSTISTPTQIATFADSPSMQLDGANNPIIAYSGQGIRLVVCDDPDCISETPILVDDTSQFSAPSLQLNGSGLPVIAYYDLVLGNLKVAVCDTLACANPTITTVDGFGDVGRAASLQLNGNNPVISYFDNTNDDLKVAICDTPTCSGGAYDFGVYSSDPAVESIVNISGVAGTTATATIIVSNIGNAGSLLDAHVSNTGISSGFSIVGTSSITPLVDGLAPDDAPVEIVIECTPDADITASGTLEIITSDPNQPRVTYELNCIAVEPEVTPEAEPPISVPSAPTAEAPIQETVDITTVVDTLPATGETPFWRNWLLVALGIIGLGSVSVVGINIARRNS